MPGASFEAHVQAVAASLPGQHAPGVTAESRGHSAGQGWERAAGKIFERELGPRVRRQHDHLNRLLLGSPEARSARARRELIPGRALQRLMSRADKEMRAWSPRRQFAAHQQDTADFVAGWGPDVTLIDVKSTAAAGDTKGKLGPNGISGRKLAVACRAALEAGEELPDIWYVGVRHAPGRRGAECVSADARLLGRVDPRALYINFAAGSQVQFFVHDLPQDYTGGPREWMTAYLAHYAAGRRAEAARRAAEADAIEEFLAGLSERQELADEPVQALEISR